MRVLFDTNILLDVLLDRAPFAADASTLWAACDAGTLVAFIPASTLTDIFYIARRASDIATARIAIGLCLAAFQTLPVDRQALEHATTLPGNDFEDNVQIACATIAGLDAIVTRNGADYADAPIAVLSPSELVARL